MNWTRAIHFKTWADVHDATYLLPHLVRRLIQAVVPESAIVNFPAMEQVQRPGCDGIVEVSSPHRFVPNGRSVWEMGVASGKEYKANEDFTKRTKQIDVVVVPRDRTARCLD